MKKPQLNPIDKEHGYIFGCDGLLTLDEACAMLRISRNTLDKLCIEKFLRKGKSPLYDPKNKSARVYICKRSVTEYIRSMEVGSERITRAPDPVGQASDAGEM